MSTKPPCLMTVWHAGKPEAPALLLLHGFGASHRWWVRMMDRLTQDYQIFCLDLRFRQTLPMMAEELLEWTRQKHLTRLSILGHSLGALLGMYCAAQAPQMVERLILINPAIAIPERSLWQWLRRCRQARAISCHPPAKDPWYRSLSPQTCRVVLKSLRHSPLIAPVATPTLVLWGSRDPLFPLAFAPHLLHEFQAVRLLAIEGGHSLMYEFPERITPAILRFLANGDGQQQATPGTIEARRLLVQGWPPTIDQ